MLTDQTWLGDWRISALVYVVCAGFWSILAKAASSRLDWATTTFVIVVSNTLVVAIGTLSGLRWEARGGVLIAAAAGALAGIGSLAFYRALRQAPASTVVPLTSQYVVLTAVLSVVFLGERPGLRQIVGIFLGLLAIVLLSTR